MKSRKVVQVSLFVKEKQTHRRGEQMYGHQVEKGAGMNWEIGTDIQTRPCIKQMTKENPPYGQGPHSVLGGDLNGEETQKEWICVYG